MKILAIFLLVSLSYPPRITEAYGRTKEGKCPSLTENKNCAAQLLDSEYEGNRCFEQDFECPGTEKCCDDGCGGQECKPAIGLPPLPVIEPRCPSSAEVTVGDQCEPANVTFCQANQCNKCCIHDSVCNPDSGVFITKDECEKKLCKDVLCPGQGEICKLDRYHRAICECPTKCPEDSTADAPVCGSDGVSYENECEMNLSACVTGDRINVVYKGACLPSNPLKICDLPKERGFGWTLEIRYFFNKGKGVCEGFLYHGKGGNENNFYRYKDCKDHCSEAAMDVCSLPQIVGPCRAAFPRWHFNMTSQRCEQFTYGGCSGNANNFRTLKACNEKCICSLPKAEGICLAYFPSWYYNSKTGQCEEFVYGGCRGNMNRFYTREICLKTCESGKVVPPKPQCQGKDKFNCRSIKKCLPISKKCNGVDDCGDNSDEENCDPCASKKCDFYSTCVTTKNNTAVCDCPTICTADWNPVCGSDNETYPNLCVMKTESCKKQKMITKIKEGECNARAKSKCEIEKEKKMKKLLVGIYIPQCEEDGSYRNYQCHGSLGYCWCVNSTGNKLPETEVRYTIPNCTEARRPQSKCEKERDAANSLELVGNFIPQCEEDGSYSQSQCYGSTGYCWCVSTEGKKLIGTEVRFNRPNCSEVTCENVTCSGQAERCELDENDRPRCVCPMECPAIVNRVCGSDDETYNNECHMNAVACSEERRINVTYRGACQPPPQNTSKPQSKCEKERDAANSLELVGNFIPQCEEDGSYSQSQCYGSTGYCWCVSTEGKKLIGTEVRFNRPNCSEVTCENVTCPGQAERCELDENDRPRCVCPMECPAILDRVCGSDGETYNNECHMNAVACSEERRIDVTYRGACQPPPQNASTPPPTGKPVNICDITLCDFGRCVEVNGTATCQCRVACPFIYSPVCGSNNKTYDNFCLLEAAACEKKEVITVKHDGRCKLPPISTSSSINPCDISLCDFGRCVLVNGTATCVCHKVCTSIYSPVCGSDNKTYPSLCLMDLAACLRKEYITAKHNGPCGKKSKCEKESELALSETRPGMMTPKCEEDGSYSPVQCLESSGYCWCVNQRGEKLPETQIRYDQPNCSEVVQPYPCENVKCDYYAQCVPLDNGEYVCDCPRFCTEEYSPVCASNGVTYDNDCLMKIASCAAQRLLTVESPGDCVPSSTTQPSVNPCDISLCDFGRCVVVNGTATCVCNACTRILQPVCGSDNKTYDNLCILDSEACSRKEHITVKHNGPCEVKPAASSDLCAVTKCGFHSKCEVVDGSAKCVCEKACTRELDLKCGSDNVTYSNPCELRRASCEQVKEISIVSDGECATAVPPVAPTIATTKPLPKCKNCPKFGKDNVLKSLCSWYNKFVIVGEIVNISRDGREINAKVEKRFKPRITKTTRFKPQSTVKIILQKTKGCRCDNLQFTKNEKYVLMGKKSKSKMFVIKWKTGFVEKASKPLVDKLQKSKSWGFCAQRFGRNRGK